MANPQAAPIKHNLGDAECDCLNRVLERTPNLLGLVQAAENCGWDVSAAKAALEEQYAMATKAKAQFFPHRP